MSSKRFDPSISHPRPVPRASAQPQNGFVPLAEALAEIGLAPKPPADAPLVAPHGPETAEFQAPRPLRRPPTRFAHLRPDDGD